MRRDNESRTTERGGPRGRRSIDPRQARMAVPTVEGGEVRPREASLKGATDADGVARRESRGEFSTPRKLYPNRGFAFFSHNIYIKTAPARVCLQKEKS